MTSSTTNEDRISILRTSVPSDEGHVRTVILGGTATALYMPGHFMPGMDGRPNRNSTTTVSIAEQLTRQLIPRLAPFHRETRCHTGYWGTAESTGRYQEVGDLTPNDAGSKQLLRPIPGEPVLCYALRDLVDVTKSRIHDEDIRVFFPVIGIEDAELDYEEVVEFCQDLLLDIAGRRFPRTTIVLAGYGKRLDLKRLKQLERDTLPRSYGGAKMIHLLHAEDPMQLPAVLSNYFAANALRLRHGSQITRCDNNKVIKMYPAATPAALSFRAPWDVPLKLSDNDEHEIEFIYDSDQL
jgi:hypothetical protein